ncbi:MAG TPA: hypothetical protein GXX25_13625 [Desulfotomaculum sp.]|nr:hypothetical protein [Desulfotomaculum sp.]
MEEAVVRAVELMAISAKTAPKTKGQDFIGIKIVTGKEMEQLADAMVEYGRKSGEKKFDRDGENVRNSTAVLLLSLDGAAKTAGLNCGACGKDSCAELEPCEKSQFKGPLCAWRLMDLGIALGSAVKTASILNLDNRIMYRVGLIARKTGMMKGEIVVGVPVSVAGKNIYFDRAK